MSITSMCKIFKAENVKEVFRIVGAGFQIGVKRAVFKSLTLRRQINAEKFPQ